MFVGNPPIWLARSVPLEVGLLPKSYSKMERVFSNLSILRSRWFVSDMMPGSIILYIFVLFFLYFIGLSMLGPRIVALQLLWQVVGGSVGGSGSGRFLRKNDGEWLWIGSYPIISTYNCGKSWWEPACWPWIIEFQGSIPLLIDRWNNQRPWITFGWMEGNAKLDLLATGVICWVYYGYVITFRSWGSLSCRNPHLARWQCFLVIFPTRVFFVQHERNKCICIYIYMYVYIYIYTRERSCCLVEWGLFRKGLSSACLLLKCQDVLSAQTLMYQIAEYSVQHWP